MRALIFYHELPGVEHRWFHILSRDTGCSMPKIRLAGALLCIGNIQFLLVMTIAEALYPGYSITSNFISDLGVGPTALLFNVSIILLGLFILISATLLYHASPSLLFNIALGLTGIGAIGVGLFPETLGVFHIIAAAGTFLFGAISALGSYYVTKAPLSYFCLFLGLFSITCFVLFAGSVFTGIGPGGMERMIAYPVILWGIALGGYLMGSSGQPGMDFISRYH
jgi:hypothetical membrane protein